MGFAGSAINFVYESKLGQLDGLKAFDSWNAKEAEHAATEAGTNTWSARFVRMALDVEGGGLSALNGVIAGSLGHVAALSERAVVLANASANYCHLVTPLRDLKSVAEAGAASLNSVRFFFGDRFLAIFKNLNRGFFTHSDESLSERNWIMQANAWAAQCAGLATSILTPLGKILSCTSQANAAWVVTMGKLNLHAIGVALTAYTIKSVVSAAYIFAYEIPEAIQEQNDALNTINEGKRGQLMEKLSQGFSQLPSEERREAIVTRIFQPLQLAEGEQSAVHNLLKGRVKQIKATQEMNKSLLSAISTSTLIMTIFFGFGTGVGLIGAVATAVKYSSHSSYSDS